MPFVIAHWLSRIIHADEILVFDRGRIVEREVHAAVTGKSSMTALPVTSAATWTNYSKVTGSAMTVAALALTGVANDDGDLEEGVDPSNSSVKEIGYGGHCRSDPGNLCNASLFIAAANVKEILGIAPLQPVNNGRRL